MQRSTYGFDTGCHNASADRQSHVLAQASQNTSEPGCGVFGWGFIVLIPALAATGGSGFFLSKGQREGRVGAKLKRMPLIAANGVAILIPAALFLAHKAKAGEFDATFYAVQMLELAAGAANLFLLGLSMRDGMALTRWRRKSFLRPATTFDALLMDKEEIARDTLAFRMSRPKGFQFAAGQSVYVSMPDLKKADGKGRLRTFSIASAPQDADLEIATRRTSSCFKRHLAAAANGSLIRIEGPYGDLSLHEDVSRPAVFLAGGIGLAPFRSIVLDATNRGLQHRLFLFYANRKAEDAAYLSELRQLERKNPRFKLIPTFTEGEMSPLDADAEHGRISAEMIKKHVNDLAAATFHVAGPPAMVAAMEDLLLSEGVSPKSIQAEEFSGY